MSQPQEGDQIKEPIEEDKVTVQVGGSEVQEVTLMVGIANPEEDYIQPEGPLEKRTEPLPRAHPPQR